MLPGAVPAWVDGGPRRPWAPDQVGGHRVVHREIGRAGPGRRRAAAGRAPRPTWRADQLAAVAHLSGPARVIAPAGSGKTRVLTERLRHLLGRPRLGARGRPGGGLQQGGPARARAAHRGVPAPGAHAQLARALGRRPAPRPLARGARGARVPAPRRVAAARPPAPAGQHRPDRSLPRGARPGAARPARRRARSRSPATTSTASSEIFGPYREQLAVARRRRLRRPDLRRGRSPCCPTGRSGGTMQQRCRHLLVDEFQDLTPAHVLLAAAAGPARARRVRGGRRRPGHLRPRRRRPRLPHRLRGAVPRRGVAPADGQLPLPGRGGRRRPHAAGYNRRRVAKEIDAGPGGRRRPRRRCGSSQHAPDDGASSTVVVVQEWLAEPGVEPSSIAVLTRVNSLLLAPQVALAEAGVPLSSVLRAEVLKRTGLRAALAYLRIATSGDAINPRDIVEIMRRPTRGLPQWFPDRLERRTSWSTKQLRAHRRPGAGQGGGQGPPPRRRPRPGGGLGPGRHHPLHPGAGARPDRPRLGHEHARPDRRRPGVEPPRRPRRPARRGRPPPRPGRVRAVAARPVRPRGGPRRASCCPPSTGSRAASGTASSCSACPTASCPTASPTTARRSAASCTSASPAAATASPCSRTAPGPSPFLGRARRHGTAPGRAHASRRRGGAVEPLFKKGAAAKRQGRGGRRHHRRARPRRSRSSAATRGRSRPSTPGRRRSRSTGGGVAHGPVRRAGRARGQDRAAGPAHRAVGDRGRRPRPCCGRTAPSGRRTTACRRTWC